ncbi:NrdH-redoxin [Mycobacteroides abscessus subsp. abscessus]|uniref:glutaredoxin domain-containing protein n=1 Tax=Mycobacteroides abscessus TaxID=36809 RepID=UPI00034A78B5|nr:glutaredoxin domain-containing protein [Mycobacteroides abscessus]OLT79666.1 NrdH-redoxin [Mycobacteroides abscessus subsp. abscessus]SHP94107.1 glutaredoxin [Mycobacteroides abscessus subsp. abscessus]SKO06477.1 glutaredoxin [Mycobacteroides abscessus subsp. abscessus]
MTNATVFTQPACGGCAFAAADLRRAGIQFAERNVRTDADAAEAVRQLYLELREPGVVPETPVILLDEQVFFGATELHEHLRREVRAQAAA